MCGACQCAAPREGSVSDKSRMGDDQSARGIRVQTASTGIASRSRNTVAAVCQVAGKGNVPQQSTSLVPVVGAAQRIAARASGSGPAPRQVVDEADVRDGAQECAATDIDRTALGGLPSGSTCAAPCFIAYEARLCQR